MDNLSFALIALGLAMDVFAVSLGIGSAGQARTPRPVFRLSFHFGLFQALMTLVGWGAGYEISRVIAGIDHWLAMAFLTIVGIRMIRSGVNPREQTRSDDPTRGMSLVMLSLATSIDAAAVGLSLALLEVDILRSALVIGLVSAALGLAGSLLGGRLAKTFGKRMEILGGILLIGIGLRVLLAHLT